MAKGNVDLTKDGDVDKSKVPFLTSSRVGLAVLGFFGFINVYALRGNMSVGIVCMVNQTWFKNQGANTTSNVTTSTECGMVENATTNATSDPDFQEGNILWDRPTQGLVLGSYFWGYLLSQIPAGWVATKIGGKRVYGWSMFASGLLTLLTPVVARAHYIGLMVLRILLGFFGGMTFPAMHSFWGHWAPPLENTKLTSFTYAGAQVGNVITFPLGGFLCKYGFAGGWPSIFYVLGVMCLVWFAFWMFLVSDTPSQHKRISDIEKKYIEQSLQDSTNTNTTKLNVPWKSMFLSLPVYAIIVSNVTSDWGAYTLLTNIPTYMNEVLKFDIAANGLYSALPYIAFWMMINISGVLADMARKKFLSTTVTRKVFDAFGKLVPALMMIGLGYVDCSNPVAAISLLTLAVSLTGFQYSGFLVNHVDIAPAYAGILFGISNSIAAVTGFVSPSVVGVITHEKQTRAEWQIVFYISAAIYTFGALFYIIFASGELQPWATDNNRSDEKEPMEVEMETKGISTNGEADAMMDNPVV